MALDDKDDVESGSPIAERRRSLQVTAIFKAGYKAGQEAPKEAIATPSDEGQKT